MAEPPQRPPDSTNLDVDRWLGRIDTRILVRFLVLFASGWALVQIVAYFELLVVVFVTAAILAFLLSHPVAWLSQWIPRGVAAVGLFLLALAGLMALGATVGLAVVAEGRQLAANLPTMAVDLELKLGELETGLGLGPGTISDSLQGQLQDQLGQIGGQLGAIGLGLVQTTLANGITAILIAVVTLFMLLDGAPIWWWLLKRLPAHQRAPFHRVVQHNLLGFFWGRLLLSLFFGVSTFVVFWLLGVPFPLLLAAIAGSFDLIPGIGATLGIGLVCLILLAQTPWLALQALVVCVLLQQVEENLLLPHIMRDSLDINPVVMFFALLVGATVAGVLGMFLAVPVAGVVVSWLNIEEMRGQSGRTLALPPTREPPS